MSIIAKSADVALRNMITDYYDWLPRVISTAGMSNAARQDTDHFSPGFDLPELDDSMSRFYAAATARWYPVGEFRDTELLLLDLMGNKRTRTTKTPASLLIVARAVQHIRRTGEPILIFSPTSANKGTALRDAVSQALELGIVRADKLRVAVLSPQVAWHKMWRDGLDEFAETRRAHPRLIYRGTNSEQVKSLGRDFVARYGAVIRSRFGYRVWFSLDLNNYMLADASRAFFENDVAPNPESPGRIHVHAVSSAFGLLGYNLGRDVLEKRVGSAAGRRPGFLLVQHLATPDMVLNLHFGDFDRARLPSYLRDDVTGLFTQHEDARFPRTVSDPDEVLDPTFYTHEPTTSPTMNELIRRHGGNGIVVGLTECLHRYPRLAASLAGSPAALPNDPRTVREWSLVMALTGAMNALERGLLPGARQLVVHGSGCYTAADYTVPDETSMRPVASAEDIAAVVEDSLSG